jgi:hypothetical protein
MKARFTLGLPVVAWFVIFLFVYIVIKSPPAGMFILSLPARLVSGVGNFFIGLVHSSGGP